MRPRSSSVVAGTMRSTIVEGQKTASANHRPRSGSRNSAIRRSTRRVVAPLLGRLSQLRTVKGATPAARRRRKASTIQPGSAPRRLRPREIVQHVGMVFDQLAARRVVAIAFLRDRQADDPHARAAHRREQSFGIGWRDDELAKGTDDANVLPVGPPRRDGIELVLRLERIPRVGGAEARPADRPVRLAGGEPFVEGNGLMRPMEGADAEMDDADARGVEVIARARHVIRKRVETGL